jgi:hypothetical protein
MVIRVTFAAAIFGIYKFGRSLFGANVCLAIT